MVAVAGTENPWLHASIGIVTAIASVGFAIAFAMILPQIKMLPSPRQQRAQLEQAVRERTVEKDKLIREINHRIGNNELQILSSIVNVERRARKAKRASTCSTASNTNWKKWRRTTWRCLRRIIAQ